MPSTALDLDALANRVLGLSPPVPIRRRRPNRGDRILALALVGSTAVATAVSLGFAAQGHAEAGLRLLTGCVLVNFFIISLR